MDRRLPLSFRTGQPGCVRARCALFYEAFECSGAFRAAPQIPRGPLGLSSFRRPRRASNACRYGAQSCASEAARLRAKCAADLVWRRALLTAGRWRARNTNKRAGLLCDIAPPLAARPWIGAISRCADGGGAGLMQGVRILLFLAPVQASGLRGRASFRWRPQRSREHGANFP